MAQGSRIRLPVQVRSPGGDDPLQEEVATHSSILAWEIPWTEEPGGLIIHWVAKESDMTERLSTQACLLGNCKKTQVVSMGRGEPLEGRGWGNAGEIYRRWERHKAQFYLEVFLSGSCSSRG